MSKTITELTTQIEELEKRIRSISASHTSLSQIIAIRDCIDQIKEYLQELNNTLDNMDNSTSDTELEALKSRVTVCENDISALQTDLGTCQDDIADVESEISAINTTVGEHTTTITNLQTTQTNLQTTQSSQASTISSIDNRLTTCENNVSTLTGGVDLTEYENRLSAIEPVNSMFQSYVHKQYNFHEATPENFTLFTREYTYTCKPNAYVYQEFKISYNFEGEGTMTVALYENNTPTGEVYTIDLSKSPTQCVLHRNFCPNTRSNNIMLKCVATSAITYKTVDITMHGQELFIFEDNQDLKVVCFNNYIYITRYYDDCVKYGKFVPTDEIDIDNLPNSRSYHDGVGCSNFLVFAAIPLYDFSTVYDESFLKISSNNNYSYCIEASQDISKSNYFNRTESNSYSNDVVIGNYKYVLMPAIQNSQAVLKSPSFNTPAFEFEKLTVNSVTEWLYAGLLIDNFYTQDMECLDAKKMGCIAFGDDGYMYLLKNRKSVTAHSCKICKGGIYATAYMQQDQTINAYICFGNYVEKYQIVPTNEQYNTCSFIERIDDCFCVYELINGNTIYKTKSGWVLNTLEDIATEEATTTE